MLSNQLMFAEEGFFFWGGGLMKYALIVPSLYTAWLAQQINELIKKF